VQINGLASENREVSNYKDLERVETNFIRNGVALVLAEGLAQKAHKILKIIHNVRKKGIKLSDWDWIEEFVDLKNKEQDKLKKEVSSATYISDIVAGRPVLGHPSKAGGFRLRYGKCRTAGLSSMAMHPLTMEFLKGYIAVGTQLKYEGPGKSSAMSLCDDIEGPIVKLNDGSVVRVDSWEKAEKYKGELEEVLFLGDFLVNYAEYFNRGKHLQKPGYCEDWYSAELEKLMKNKVGDVEEKVKVLAEKIVKDWHTKVSIDEAAKLSELFGIALYPKYIFYWDQINKDLFLALLDWISHSQIKEGKLVLPFNKTEQERFSKGKTALELVGVEHGVATEDVVLSEKESKALLLNLGIEGEEMAEEVEKVSKKISKETVLDIVNEISGFRIKDKSGTWIGARMGRPEKAKLRKLTGSPHVLFPIGEEGGRLRSVFEAINVGSVKADFPIFYCEKCQQESVYTVCERCDNKTKKMHYCPECQQKFVMEKCPQHNLGKEFNTRRIDIKHFFDAAVKKLGLGRHEVPAMIKGVRGTSSLDHTPENLAKGIIRARHNLNVNKDGTIRYDLTEMPLTHFKPKEIGTSVEKLRELGYTEDYKGEPLENDDQLIEILPQDVILPACPETKDEKADDVFLNVTKYVDELLERFYEQKPFYGIKTKEDLRGHLVLGLAPHTSAGIVGRIIGFGKVQAGVAHPMWHAAMRRDCEGDETCVILLLDVFLNFKSVSSKP
jgi:DNA polymerase II large subunit